MSRLYAIVATASLLGACAAPRFAALGPGNYFCQAQLATATSTCGITVPMSSMTAPIDGVGTDLLYVNAPSATDFIDGTWTPVQFGTEPSPTSSSTTGTVICGGATVAYTLRAHLTTLSTDHVEVDLAYDYTGVNHCAGVMVDACRLEYQLVCTRV